MHRIILLRKSKYNIKRKGK